MKWRIRTYDRSFFTIFVVINILSFFTLFVSFPAGLVVSLLLLMAMVAFPVTYIGPLFRKEHLPFTLFILFELFSLVYYYIIPMSQEMLRQHPTLLMESVSYLLIPQVFFYCLGVRLGEKKGMLDSAMQKLLLVNVCFLLFAIVLHFTRPTFFNSFLERTLGDLYEYYGGAYPRMTGYLNSMIVGMLASSGFIITLGFIPNEQKWRKGIYAFVFVVSSFLSLQRGSWVAILIGLGFLTAISFFERPGKTMVRVMKAGAALVVAGVLVTVLLLRHGSFEDVQLLGSLETELFNRIASIGEAAGERSNQFDNFVHVITQHPYGIGMGMLSHKSAVYGFAYATPDGNYFRITGDTGVVGGLIFVLTLMGAFFLLACKRQYALLIALLLFSMQAYGTNVFDLYYVSFIFWTLLGVAYARPANGTEMPEMITLNK